MIANIFPPEGSAGTYRPLRFIRHLPAYGWLPTIIAAEQRRYERYDPELLKRVPSTTEILRVPNPDKWVALQQDRTYRYRKSLATASIHTLGQMHAAKGRSVRSILRNAVRKLEGMVYHPDTDMCWIRPAANAAIQACNRKGADVVWATGSPWSSLVVARNVSLRTGRPYVLDFRDSWLLEHDGFQRGQPEWARARNRRLLGNLFRDAQAIILRYGSEAESYYRAFPGTLTPERVHLIPNGYEGTIDAFEAPPQDRCTVIYTGYAYYYWYETVLEALAVLKKSRPNVAQKLRVVFVGEGTQALKHAAAVAGIDDIVETNGVVPFKEINRLQSEAHALLLLGWKPGRSHEFRGSKIFGYLKAGRPIVGVLPDDENRKILRSVGVQTIANAGSISETVNLFQLLVDDWEAGNLSSLLPDPDKCKKYSAEYQTHALVQALEGLPALDPFVPGACKIPPSLQEFIGPQGWVKRW